MNGFEMGAFVFYFLAILSIGIYFFVKSKAQSEKDYFLGGRNMGGWVSALSAGASDMSAWVLMGLPGAIYMSGLSQIWISVGLIGGTLIAWIFIAPKLRRFAIKADDSITVPQFLSNRFKSKSPILRVSCAVIFVVGYCLYAASSVYACGELFHMLVPTISMDIGMIIMTIVIVAYTLLGGFNAVCWTDFLQGMLMLVALLSLPLIAFIILKTTGTTNPGVTPDNFYNILGGSFGWESVASILTGLSWGLGYLGMPHILVRYMAIKSEKEMKKSRIIGSVWTFLILLAATFLGIVAREFLGNTAEGEKERVFVNIVRAIFNPGALAIIGGLLISAIIAASMSTADSQLLASSSSFASDIYKTTINKKATEKQLLWVGRLAVIVVTALALGIALLVYYLKIGSIMQLVSAAWSIFGAAFGPTIVLALFWRRFNEKGAIAGIITGFIVSILWMVLFNLEYYGFSSLAFNTKIYELLPGFVISLVVAIVVSKCTKKPSEEVLKLFDSVSNKSEEE